MVKKTKAAVREMLTQETGHIEGAVRGEMKISPLYFYYSIKTGRIFKLLRE